MLMESKSQKDDVVNQEDEDAELLALTKLLSECRDESTNCEAPAASVDNQLSLNTPQFPGDGGTFNESKANIESNKIAENNDFDSSDEIEVTNCLESNYNEFGYVINNKIKQQQLIEKDSKIENDVNLALNSSRNVVTNSRVNNFKKVLKCNITHNTDGGKREQLWNFGDRNVGGVPKQQHPTCTDPVFGLRIIDPLVSSTLLLERMQNRKAIHFSNVVMHTERGDLSQDWVIAGVLVNKRPVQMAKNNQPYSIWQLSDLKGEIRTLSLFLFNGAHKELWKTEVGTCIAILNPIVFEKRADSRDIVCLSIDTSKKVMILGKSKDLGACKARKRNGDVCNAIVNMSECNTCVFHMKQEYNKMSKRSELQSDSTGRGLQNLRNKILGKSEVFYGGQSFMARPSKKSVKLTKKDEDRLISLSEYAISPFAKSVNHQSKSKSTLTAAIPYEVRHGPISKVAANIDASSKQRVKDLERLKILKGDLGSSTTNCITDKSDANKSTSPKDISTLKLQENSCLQDAPASSILAKFKNRTFSSQLISKPTLSKFNNFSIQINSVPYKAELAKQKAKQILNNNPIEKQDPNSMRGTKGGKRRAIDILNEKIQIDNDTKRQKVEETEKSKRDRIQRIIEAASSHADLIKSGEKHLEDVYFDKLTKKEALEDKMLGTHKISCKAVICSMCKYTAFSAAERCKKELHPIKVVDATKRFFQCKHCGYRTVTLFKLPKINCKQCDSSHWQRAGMIRERKLCTGNEDLSIRGDEELFIGSISSKKHLNLLIPDE